MRLQKLILKDVAREDILLGLYGDDAGIRKKKVSTRTLYIRGRGAEFFKNGQEGVKLDAGAVVSLNTYLNSFSTGKWKKYTIVERLHAVLELEGHVKIALMHAEYRDKKISERLIAVKEFRTDGKEEIRLEFGELEDNGIFFLQIKALEDSRIYSGYYGTEELEPTQKVKLAVDICTFKREEYVKRNMNILKRDILENPDSPCYQKVWVHISDNASSLAGIVDSQPGITVDTNANLGGVGGFTRGIIETKKREKEEGFTHILIMDDDATISSAAVEVNYLLLSYLKKEFFGYTVGGKLMVLDAPFIQFEVGAQWNAGDIVPLKSEWDVRNYKDVLKSEIEDKKVEYQGWWYCCIPLSEIEENNLPLPIFIHRDDIEYGMRTGKGRFIYMNQICIWHEAFAGKMPGMLDYYDIRNHCITNAIHCPDYTAKDFKKFLSIWVWRNIAKYRYKYVDYNIKAVEDFCKGIDWLLETDGGQLHRELMAMNYQAKPAEEFVGENGVTLKAVKKGEIGYYNPIFPVRMFHKITANGYFFPAKDHDAVVTAPYGSVHTLYRRDRTVVVDHFGKGVYLERDRQKLWECREKLQNALKLVDEKYDAAARSYRERYGELVSRAFWEKYLGI